MGGEALSFPPAYARFPQGIALSTSTEAQSIGGYTTKLVPIKLPTLTAY